MQISNSSLIPIRRNNSRFYSLNDIGNPIYISSFYI